MSKEHLEGIYSWLQTEPIPKMVNEALKFYGIKENYTDEDNPNIKTWVNTLGFDLEKFHEISNGNTLIKKNEIEFFNIISNNSYNMFGDKLKIVNDANFVRWCGLFMGYVAKESGKKVVKEPFLPINWIKFGKKAPVPMLGDVLIFMRATETKKESGHLGLYIGEDKDCYHVLGGNQNNKVCITRILKSRLYVARRPKYKIVPHCVRIVLLPSKSALTKKLSV